MKPLIVLIGTFLLANGVIWLKNKQMNYQLAGRIAMACMLLFTAIGHFVFAEGMRAMLPDFVPAKTMFVMVSGAMEIGFALALLWPKYHQKKGMLLIVFFLLVLPANVYAAMQQINYQTGQADGPGLSYLWFRVPLQLFFMGWVYMTTIWYNKSVSINPEV